MAYAQEAALKKNDKWISIYRYSGQKRYLLWRRDKGNKILSLAFTDDEKRCLNQMLTSGKRRWYSGGNLCTDLNRSRDNAGRFEEALKGLHRKLPEIVVPRPSYYKDQPPDDWCFGLDLKKLFDLWAYLQDREDFRELTEPEDDFVDPLNAERWTNV